MRFWQIVFTFIGVVNFSSSIFARKINHHYKTTVAEDPIPESEPTSSKSWTKHSAKPKTTPDKGDDRPEYSVEDVDEEQIDELLRDSGRNLVVFFYDGRVRCSECADALSEIEEIDDDIEATGYIEVVKTDDRRVARECGITTFPALVYFRKKNPILYDGDFKDSEIVWRWIRAHDEVVTWELNDDNFEDRTDSYSPDEGTLDWFVMFYDSEDPDCNAYIPTFETVAHKLRGLVSVGKVDTSVSDDVSERFRIDDSRCPTLLLFHRGKMYRYNEPARDVRGLTQFALQKFKDQRGHRVPEPPTALEHFYEHIKERVTDALEDNQTLTAVSVGGALIITITALLIKAYRIKKEQQASGENKKST